jgi:hypothetical protein
MKISVFAEDLVKRCVWDHYVYYVLGSDKDAEQLLKENKEFEISERDALVIGLLKVIETSNLIHKFNTYVVDFLANKSISQGKDVLVRKKGLETSVDKFLDKFPDYWIPNVEYKKSLTELVDYIEVFKSGVEKIDIIKVTDQFGTHEYLNSNNVKKLLSFNY